MNKEKFNKLADKIFDRCTAILYTKSKEYSIDKDKLHNFKRAARMENCTPQKALIGMWVKHVISILDIADGNVPYDIATIEEKVTDSINYLVLFEALMKEQDYTDEESDDSHGYIAGAGYIPKDSMESD